MPPVAGAETEAATAGPPTTAGGSASAPASSSVEAVRALARASRLLERASGEVNLAHYRVLAAIASGDQRASRIAAKLALGKPAISASVDSLCQRGLLVRSGVQGDQRAAALELTPAGERFLADVEAAMVVWLDDLCARTPDAVAVRRTLAWVGQAIEQMAAERHAGARR